MRLMIWIKGIFLDSYPNWIHQPNVLPRVPFRKGIQIRLRSWYATLWISHPVYSLALRLRNTKVTVWTHGSIWVPENGHQPLGRGNSLWHSACPILWSKPILVRYFTKIAPSVLPCPKTQEHQSTCVDSWVHRVPENGHQPLGRGNSLWRSACPILWSNPILLRYFTKIAPSVLPCPKTQEHQSTCVDSWVHRVPENGHQPLGKRQFTVAFSLSTTVIQPPILLRYFTKIAPSVLPCPNTQEHQSTCVDSCVNGVPENGHQPLGRGNSLLHSACPIMCSDPIF